MSMSIALSTYPQNSNVSREATGATGARYGTTAHGRKSRGSHQADSRWTSGTLSAKTSSLARQVRSRVQVM